MCCAKIIVFGRFLIMDCLIHMFEHCLMSYRTVWVDEPSSFVVPGVANSMPCVHTFLA